MDGKDRLEQLKEQVIQTSNQQYRVQQAREELQDRKAEVILQKSQKEQEMSQFIQNIFFKNEIANQEERAILSDKIEHFAFHQQDMKEQIIKLNDYLTSPGILDGIFEERRKRLEEHYIELENRLNDQIGYVENELKEKQKRLNQVQESIKKLEEKERELKGEIDKRTILNKIFKPGIFFVVGIIDYFSGYYIMGMIWNLLKQFLGSIQRLF